MIEIKKTNLFNSALSINYIETDLTGSDFTQLNTVPLTIVAAIPNKFIIPVFFHVQYNFSFLSTIIYIADLNTFNLTNQSYYFNFNTTDFAGSPNGFLTFPVLNSSNNNFFTQVPNITTSSSISLVSQSNSPLMSIQTLKVRVGYYILEQF